MDSLALLCGSHDDPSVLRRLVDAGCSCRADLVRWDLDALARTLGWSREAAQQLQCAARALDDSVAERRSADVTPLRPDLIEGLDLGACVALRAFGVESLEDLASVEALELSRAMECGVTRVMRLQVLALQKLANDASQVRMATAAPGDLLQPVTRRPLTSHPPRFSPAERTSSATEPALAHDLERWGARSSGGTSRAEREHQNLG